jgi:hypothetical protein
MPEEQEKLNPQITDVEIGVRSLRKITIYPLSMGDQLKMTDLIIKAITEQVDEEGASNLSVSFIVKVIHENIGKILEMVSDEKETILDELSNSQAIEIAEILFDVNYGSVSKNFKSLSTKLMGLFQPERPLPQFANDTDTGSMTSTESPIETVV